MKQVQLKAGRGASIERRHPWIFSRALLPTKGLEMGDLVEVLDSEGHFCGRGYYEGGTIAVRMLTFQEGELVDASLWQRRFEEALEMRRALGLLASPREGFRLVYGEGDGLPGLIVDLYGGVAVMQAHTLSMHLRRRELAEALVSVLEGRIVAVYFKSSDSLPMVEGVVDELLYGSIEEVEQVVAEEQGICFSPDILRGQKTGFFLDQRQSRARVGALARGRKVLNMFCYTGGFSLYALRGGAERVVSLDSSPRAMDLLESNLKLNFGTLPDCHESVVGDAFKYLYDMEEGTFDMIVLDPPAFAKRREVLRNGLQGYRKLNSVALRKIAKGGLLFTFSCSQVVGVEEFRQALFTAALHAGREVRVLEQFGQFADHPVSIYHPEGSYLKGFLLYVS